MTARERAEAAGRAWADEVPLADGVPPFDVQQAKRVWREAEGLDDANVHPAEELLGGVRVLAAACRRWRERREERQALRAVARGLREGTIAVKATE